MKKINFESELKVLKENKFYRFSDLFFKKGIRWESDRDTILEKDEYKHTILRKYLEKKTKEYDYDTIKKLQTYYASFISKDKDKQKEALANAQEINLWAEKHNLAIVQESYYKLFERKKSA